MPELLDDLEAAADYLKRNDQGRLALAVGMASALLTWYKTVVEEEGEEEDDGDAFLQDVADGVQSSDREAVRKALQALLKLADDIHEDAGLREAYERLIDKFGQPPH